MLETLILIFGLIIGAVAIYFVMRPKMQSVQKLDQEIIQKNIEMGERLESVSMEVSTLEITRNQLNDTITNLIDTQQKSANAIYEACINEMQERLSANAEKLGEKYRQDEKDAQTEYLDILKELSEWIQKDTQAKKLELSKIENTLAHMQSLTNAAIEANKRAYEISQKSDFYRLVLSKEDIQEIERLREVTPYLRDSEPLNKVIWKVYYENPYTDMIGRVVGKGVHTGIYKITNLENGMCYVGQAANIADRWKQHIKRGIGAETPTRNKLYPAMLAIGVENFTFEIVEECDRTKLNEREDYWQDYFRAKEFGYSIR